MKGLKDYSDAWKGSLLPKGKVAFSRLPVNGNVAGHMYTITESFVPDGYEIQKRRRFFLSSTNEFIGHLLINGKY